MIVLDIPEGLYTDNDKEVVSLSILTKPNDMSYISELIEGCFSQLTFHSWDNNEDFTILLVPLEML